MDRLPKSILCQADLLCADCIAFECHRDSEDRPCDRKVDIYHGISPIFNFSF